MPSDTEVYNTMFLSNHGMLAKYKSTSSTKENRIHLYFN